MQMRAAERYALGELSVSEVEEFERHFFDCSQCSEELRALAILEENARAVLLEQAPAPVQVVDPPKAAPRERASWQQFFRLAWVPAMAAVVVALFAGYEYGVSRTGSGPQPIGAYPLYSAARGDETVVNPAAGAKFYSLYLDKTWDGDFVSYRAAFCDTNNSTEFTVPVPAPQPGRPMYILVPANSLKPGKYVLVILGTDQSGKETEAARYPFTLTFK